MMSNCSVRGCKTRKRVGDIDISFHRFPKSEPYFSLWLQACGRGDWRPPSVHARVCSRHFENDLLIKSESVTFLASGAVPTKFVHTSSDNNEKITEVINTPDVTKDALDPRDMIQVCRICLRMDRKMFSVCWNNLKQAYENLTLIKIEEDKRPRMLCWECSHRLLSCASFIGLAKRSDSLLSDLLLVEPYLTPENVKSLDIDKFYTTKLKSKLFPTNHSDLNIEESETTFDQKHIDPIHDSNDENSQSDVEIKLEIYEDDERESNCDPDVENYDENEIFTNCLNVKESKSVGRMKNKKNCKTPEELDPTTFVTTTLSMEDQVKEVIQRKETENYKNSPFKCDQCYKGFLDEGIYRSHMTRHSDLCGIYVCEVCKLHFYNARALRHHLTSHTHRFSCRRCPFVTPRRYAAKLHNKYHNGTRYNCSQCNEDFGKFSTYMSHLRIKHPSDFVCELCGHSFVSTKGLALHRSLKHRFDQRVVTGNSVKCEKCNINFVCEEALQQHRKVSAKHKDGQLIRTNKEMKAFNCESNERTTKKKVVKTLKRLSRHKSKGPIICEQCDKQLPNALAYHWHFRNAHPDKNRTRYPAKPHRCMCEVCGKMFQSLALLHDHSWSHTGVKQFQCSQCHKTFARRYRLIAHRRLHAADRRRHPCAVCGKLFSTLSNLQRHKATHSGLRPFKCEMCGKSFKHASLLKDHVKYVHMKAPWPKRKRGKHSEMRTTLSQTTTATGASETDAGPMWDG